MEFAIAKYAMPIRKKLEKSNNGKYRTAETRKRLNTWREGKFQVLGYIGNRQH